MKTQEKFIAKTFLEMLDKYPTPVLEELAQVHADYSGDNIEQQCASELILDRIIDIIDKRNNERSELMSKVCKSQDPFTVFGEVFNPKNQQKW